jgi:hypothetical protein
MAFGPNRCPAIAGLLIGCAVVLLMPTASFADNFLPPSFDTPEQVNAYVRLLSPKEAACSENKYGLVGCYVTRGRAQLYIEQKHEINSHLTGLQARVTNTSLPREDDYRAAVEAYDAFVQTSILPFLSSLGLDPETAGQCTSKDMPAEGLKFRLTFGDKLYWLSCSYKSGDYGRALSYILLTDFK